MGRLEDEAAIGAAWRVLKAHGIPDGLLGVFYHEAYQTFILHFEEEASGYREWVRVGLASLENLPEAVLEEAAERLVDRIRLTRPRYRLGEERTLN